MSEDPPIPESGSVQRDGWLEGAGAKALNRRSVLLAC